jgi:hypothetical protein
MYSHRPHPLHLLASTVGRWLLSRTMASKGQTCWHWVQPAQVHATHFSLSTSATPNLTASFSIGCRAPVGQTSIHLMHRLQYPKPKFSLGMPTSAAPSARSTGDMVPVGQTCWHFWHFMQSDRNSSSFTAPGGRRNLSVLLKRRMKPPRPTTMAVSPTNTRNTRRVSGELKPRSISFFRSPTGVAILPFLESKVRSPFQYPEPHHSVVPAGQKTGCFGNSRTASFPSTSTASSLLSKHEEAGAFPSPPTTADPDCRRSPEIRSGSGPLSHS